MTARRAALIGLLAWVGCKAREDAFYERIYSCDNNARGDSCGTTRQGQPMTCFAASQLGGEDFCAEACDPALGSADPAHFKCLSSGALLRVCHPRASASDPTWRCPSGLECYRTDVLSEDGLCVQMHVCTEDSDCGEKRPVCAAQLLRKRVGPSLPIAADHLQCVQSMCGAGKAMCPAGEQCLASYFDGVAEYDICVPQCDGQLRCPPNFTCAVSPISSGSPSLCLPGVPGTRCYQDQDCVAGTCIDTGAGFNMCVIPLPCQSNQDCGVLSGPAATFVCAEGVPGAGARCVLRETFSGTNCADEAGCPAGFICTPLSAVGSNQTHGECRLPCGADGSCPARGGIPHICVADGLGGCVPSGFGLPCASEADCLSGLQCLAVGPDEREELPLRRVCTTACESDTDCSGNPLVHGNFCRADEKVCRFAGDDGAPCDRDAQCRVGGCAFDASGVGRCAR